MEQWRPVVGLEGRYDVANRGRVRNAATGHIRKPYKRPGLAYQLVSYRDGPTSRSFYVHRAVLEAFMPRSDSANLECHHRNFNPADNRLANLRWSTKAENLRFTWRAGAGERQADPNRTPARVVPGQGRDRRSGAASAEPLDRSAAAEGFGRRRPPRTTRAPLEPQACGVAGSEDALHGTVLRVERPEACALHPRVGRCHERRRVTQHALEAQRVPAVHQVEVGERVPEGVGPSLGPCTPARLASRDTCLPSCSALRAPPS